MIILASTSPRRKEILSYFTLPFMTIAPQFDEEALHFNGNPENHVKKLAEGKAASIQKDHPNSLILAADTIVFREGKIYGKPKNEKEACRSLSELVGQWHDVYTGVALQKEDLMVSGAEVTRVLFNELTEEQINHYISHTHWADKAGGYAIQLAAGLIVRKIEGCYYNVMGLPINLLADLLKKVKIELWNFV